MYQWWDPQGLNALPDWGILQWGGATLAVVGVGLMTAALIHKLVK
jgi:hypothetical protein